MGKTVQKSSTEWGADEMKCKPINTVDGLFDFVCQSPPEWASLCTELVPHSALKINNIRVNERHPISLESPRTFCHFSPEEEEIELTDEKELPRTLLCHDMDNGYHDDSFVDGTLKYDAYTFYNWAGIDIFCYFSHHFVTIPPVGWINVAHAHGVRVIGTLITEYADGTAVWKHMLATRETMDLMINSLVAIAKTFKFEGWLLNIEHKVTDPDKLLEFVKKLHAKLHSEVPNAVLIWYDSVTNDGLLNWQNKLNGKNRQFFDACDGIFTNYSWTEDDVKSSAIEAGSRIHDVYIGIDVWGRNFYGGGQFNTQEAVALVRKHGCSIAIFGPAWTHEAIPEEPGPGACSVPGTGPGTGPGSQAEPLSRFQCFLLRDRALWGSLWPYLNTRLPNQLPFKTSFCRGFGLKRRLYGEVLSQAPWYNLRHMQYQPNAMHGPHGFLLASEKKLIDVSEHDAKSGEGILRYRASAMSLHKMKTLKERTDEDLAEDEDTQNCVGVTQDVDFEKKFKDELDATVAKIHCDSMCKDEAKDEGKDEAKDEAKEGQTVMIEKVMVEEIKQRIIQEQLKEEKEKEEEMKLLKEEKRRKEEIKLAKMRECKKKNDVQCECHLADDLNINSNLLIGAICKPQSETRHDIQPEPQPEVDTEINPETLERKRKLTIEEPDTKREEESNVYRLNTDFPKSVGILNERDDDSDPDSSKRNSLSRKSGRSMVTMSVSLRLGHSGPSATRLLLAAVLSERPCGDLALQDSFSGGCCLTINPSDMVLNEPRTIRLLFCDFICDSPLIVCVVTKHVIGYEKQTLNITLCGEDESKKQTKVTLIGRNLPQTDSPTTRVPIDDHSDAFKQLQQYILLNQPNFYVPVENVFGWKVRYYETKPLNCRLRWVSCHTTMPVGPILLGHIAFCARK